MHKYFRMFLICIAYLATDASSLHASQESSLETWPDSKVCEWATSASNSTRISWSLDENRINYLIEAKNRGIDCGVSLQTKSDYYKKRWLKQTSITKICALATENFYGSGGLSWEKGIWKWAAEIVQQNGLNCNISTRTKPVDSVRKTETMATNVFITNYDTGEILLSKNADKPMQPASMAKIMTVFVAFQYIANKKLQMDDKFVVSEKAWRRGGSRTFLEVGSRVSVRDILHGIIVQSGNDAAIAIAEGISGSEDAFVDEMNLWAKQIGMRNSNFRNSTGWPDPELTTTARDLNILATELIRRFPADKYPDLYPIFAKREYTYNKIRQPNRNPLVYGSAGADGLKTGHTKESGYGLVGSAERDGQRVIMVLNGMTSMQQRSAESRRLMDFYLRQLQASKQPANKSKLDKSKSICKEIGFTSGTEKFGDCVLKMMDN